MWMYMQNVNRRHSGGNAEGKWINVNVNVDVNVNVNLHVNVNSNVNLKVHINVNVHVIGNPPFPTFPNCLFPRIEFYRI